MKAKALTKSACRNYIKAHLFKSVGVSDYTASTKTTGLVGVELEIFPFIDDAKGIRPVPLFGENSLVKALLETSGRYGGIPSQYPGNPSHTECITFPDGDRFLLEPGGQLEISTAPVGSIGQLEKQLAGKQEILDMVTHRSHIHFGRSGSDPWWDAASMTNQLLRPRYQALEEYFNSIGPYGRQMMLQTCSLHINLDLGESAETRTKRITAANLLIPFTSALFANSAVSAGKPNGYKSYRNFLWQNLDARRTGILALDRLSQIDESELIDLYLDFVLDAPLIYIPELGDQVIPRNMTFRYWIENQIDGLFPALPDLIHHISLLFPEVRLKGYMEIRSVDVPPVDWQLIPVMFYTGLLYHGKYLDQTLDLLHPLAHRLNELHIRCPFGLASDEIFVISKKLTAMALEAFSHLPETFKKPHHTQQFCRFFEQYTIRRRTFADDQLDALTRDGAAAEN